MISGWSWVLVVQALGLLLVAASVGTVVRCVVRAGVSVVARAVRLDLDLLLETEVGTVVDGNGLEPV